MRPLKILFPMFCIGEGGYEARQNIWMYCSCLLECRTREHPSVARSCHEVFTFELNVFKKDSDVAVGWSPLRPRGHTTQLRRKQNSSGKKTMIQRVAQGVSARLFAFTREVKLIALSLATPSV